MKAMTPAQATAVSARGNVLLEAGAGAGKTSTLVARCLAQLEAREALVSIDEVLMVTFTEAAAAEMRRRIREALSARVAAEPANLRLAEQLALLEQARIGTLHSFCFRLVRDHFHELGLDPQSQVLDEGEARLLASETAGDVVNRCFELEPTAAGPVLDLIRRHGEGDAGTIEELVIATHHHLQTLPDPEGWLAREVQAWQQYDRRQWEVVLADEFQAARSEWLEELSAQPVDNVVAHQCAARLRVLAGSRSRAEIAQTAGWLAGFREEAHWDRNKGKHRDPILGVLDEAELLASLTSMGENGVDPLELDFALMQPHVLALIGLVREFGREFSLRKRQRAGLDFSDLEQISLRLLWDADANAPSPAARHWRARLKSVLVDEYQDINEVQDRIIAAISREANDANRFLVGDVKQSIYGFRLARPDIFLRYARTWRAGGGAAGQVLPLSDNFRSHETILDFVNACFALLLRDDLGGIGYPEDARLKFGDPEGRKLLARGHDARPRVELCLRLTSSRRPVREGEKSEKSEDAGAEEDLTNAELEAVLAANQLRQLKATGIEIFDREQRRLRPVEWGDMAILMRATSGRAEVFAQVFARAGIPLRAERGGFFESVEISDFVNLFLLLDNPRQDLPLLAVLRSPLVGLSPDELVAVRTAAPGERCFWTALQRYQEMAAPGAGLMFRKLQRFLDAFARWREQVRRGSLSHCLEEILDATQYLTWLEAQPRGRQRADNVQRLLELTRRYDSWQGRGLHRFLKYVRLLDEDGQGPDSAAPATGDAVRLMTIHASKGLEFPVVVLAGLNRPIRRDAPQAGFFIDDELGICPEVISSDRNLHYPSLRLLRAERQREERTIAEEIRLLYVAMTRACDRLLLVGTVAESRAPDRWSRRLEGPLSRLVMARARSPLDLIGPLLPALCQRDDWHEVPSGASELLAWRIIGPDERIEILGEAVGGSGRTIERPTAGELEALTQRLAQPYPFIAATRQVGKTTVTRIRRQLTEQADSEAGRLFPDKGEFVSRLVSRQLSAAEVGVAHHTFFQKLSYDAVANVEDLQREAERLVNLGELSAEEQRVLQFNQIASFWRSPVGVEILARRSGVERELEFTTVFSTSELATLAGTALPASPGEDPIVVQGIVDLAVINPGDIWLLDYKTDEIPVTAITERARRYQPQVELYRRALARIYRRPVTRAWLHFLGPGITVALDEATPRA